MNNEIGTWRAHTHSGCRHEAAKYNARNDGEIQFVTDQLVAEGVCGLHRKQKPKPTNKIEAAEETKMHVGSGVSDEWRSRYVGRLRRALALPNKPTDLASKRNSLGTINIDMIQ